MNSATKKRLQSSHGSQSSFSSSTSSSSSCSPSFRSAAPSSPFPSFHISKVPFSWEQHPGIPKESSHGGNHTDASLTMLPLPPSAAAAATLRRFSLETIWKKTSHGSLVRDPFAAALVECSKDGDGQQDDRYASWKVSRSVSDRFGFLDRYASCKKSCAVAESVILLPRSIRKP